MIKLPENPNIGFIGFGEVGAALAIRLHQHGVNVSANDSNIVRPGGLDRLRVRAQGRPVCFFALPKLVSGADILLSCVPPAASHEVVQAVLPFLKSDQIFIDATSVKPTQKRANADVVAAAGAFYLDAVVLDAVASAGADARLLVSGSGSDHVVSVLTARGLNVRAFGKEVGDAAMLKMLRSIWSKGFEALLIESLMAARRAGLEEELWATIDDFARGDVAATARGWVSSHLRACRRRRDEMTDVVETAEQLGVQPILTTAVQRFFVRSATFSHDRSDWDPASILEALSRRLEGDSKAPE